MKSILIALMVISVLFVASCTVQRPANQPTENNVPSAIEVETNTAPAVESAQVYQVVIENGKLMPVDVEINAGDTIEWVNKDGLRYTLRLGNSAERLPVGGIFEQTFTELGIVRYTATVVEENQDDDDERELHGSIIVG